MEVETDAVPSAPRPNIEATGESVIPDPKPEVEQATPNKENIRAKPTRKAKNGKRKGERIDGHTSFNQSIVIAHSNNVNLSLNTLNVQMCGHSRNEDYSSHDTGPTQMEIPANIQALFDMKRKLTRKAMVIVSECLSLKSIWRLGKLLGISEADMDRVQDNFERKGAAEVIFQILLSWRQDFGDSNMQLFPFLCWKLWEMQEGGGKVALDKLCEEYS